VTTNNQIIDINREIAAVGAKTDMIQDQLTDIRAAAAKTAEDLALLKEDKAVAGVWRANMSESIDEIKVQLEKSAWSRKEIFTVLGFGIAVVEGFVRLVQYLLHLNWH
jgi:phage replication-related protein YjqB (UPF0714/DUF867 family)